MFSTWDHLDTSNRNPAQFEAAVFPLKIPSCFPESLEQKAEDGQGAGSMKLAFHFFPKAFGCRFSSPDFFSVSRLMVFVFLSIIDPKGPTCA